MLFCLVLGSFVVDNQPKTRTIDLPHGGLARAVAVTRYSPDHKLLPLVIAANWNYYKQPDIWHHHNLRSSHALVGVQSQASGRVRRREVTL